MATSSAAFVPTTAHALDLTLSSTSTTTTTSTTTFAPATTVRRIPCATPASLCRPPRSAGGASGGVAILYLRAGELRLADNPAVAAAARHTGPIQPVVLVGTSRGGAGAMGRAVIELRADLTQLHSTLVVLQQQDDLHCVIDTVRARTVFYNDSTRHPAPRTPRGVRLCPVSGIDTLLIDAPHSLPSPPSSSSSLGVTSATENALCSTTGRDRLTYLVNARRYSHAQLLAMLHDELYTGTISAQRVSYEVSCCQQQRSKNGGRLSSPTSTTLDTFFNHTGAPLAMGIAAYDVNGGDRRGVEWDEATGQFVLREWEHAETERRMTPKERVKEFVRRRRQFLKRSFIPDDVTPDYYSFTMWRFAQRCVSSTIGVFGTSSLLFALGIRSGRIGQAAVISWVLKEGLGRVGKMLWAGSMGKDFDIDPKRWRFRSALLYALGNGLEIVTQIFPASFLLFATAANSMKQVSMLTSSATRNAMYRSFGERSQNIANITAKGEAQIVVADLIGMACGIRLSKIVSASRLNVLSTYVVLTLLDVFGIYMELRSVVFRSLNPERTSIIVRQSLRSDDLPTPAQVSPNEAIFLTQRSSSFVRLSSIAKAARSPAELDMLLRVFRRERFLVAPPAPEAKTGVSIRRRKKSHTSVGPCRLVLRNDASNEDVLRAMWMVGHVRKELRCYAAEKDTPIHELTVHDYERVLHAARAATKRSYPSFVAALKKKGWDTENLLFSTLKRRGYWRS